MTPFLDGWHVLQQHAPAVLLAAGLMLWGGAVFAGLCRRPAAPLLDLEEALSLAAGAWIIPVLVISGLVLLLAPPLQAGQIQFWVAVLVAAVPLLLVWRPGKGGLGKPEGDLRLAAALLFILMTLVVLRLAFLKETALPLYFDSAAHYGLVRQLLEEPLDHGAGRTLILPLASYYHLGYHILLAAWTRLTRLEIAELMLVSGQILLAVAPLSLYLPAHRLTSSRLGGLVAVILGALGWYMPSYAVELGQVPSLVQPAAHVRGHGPRIACCSTGASAAAAARPVCAHCVGRYDRAGHSYAFRSSSWLLRLLPGCLSADGKA